jgi:hypothetical protein
MIFADLGKALQERYPRYSPYAGARARIRRKNTTEARKYDWRRFDRLDDPAKPGLSEAEFFQMFIQCACCGYIMTRIVYHAHECDEDVLETDADEEAGEEGEGEGEEEAV